MINKHPEIGEQERKDIAVESMSYLWLLTFNFLIDYFGPDQGLRLIRPVLNEFGIKGALTNKERLKLENNNLMSIAECLDFIFNSLTMESQLTVDNDRAEWKVTHCPFSQSSVEVCEAFETITAEMVNELNPEMNGHHYQMMSKGAPFCRYVVETKRAFGKADG